VRCGLRAGLCGFRERLGGASGGGESRRELTLGPFACGVCRLLGRVSFRSLQCNSRWGLGSLTRFGLLSGLGAPP
jgi:hypothetical protein